MSPHSHKEQQQAWMQLVVLASVIALLGVLAAREGHAPADRGELRASVDELRSDTEELALVNREIEKASLPIRVAAGHLAQLDDAIARSIRDLSGLHAVEDLQRAQQEGVAAGNTLLALSSSLSRGDDIRARLAGLRSTLTRLSNSLR